MINYKKDKKIVLIVGDIGYGIFDEFRKIIQVDFTIGTEQSIIGVASGMAQRFETCLYNYTIFNERPFEN